MTANDINVKIHNSKAEKIQVYPCRNLRASNLGHPCERYLYLLIKHWDEQTPPDVSLQNIFDLGNTIEAHTIQTIKDAGYEVFTPTVRSWKIEKPLITGREDIRIKDENGELFPVEIKGLSPTEFDRLNSIEDFQKSKRAYVKGYPAQLYIYMLKFGKEKGFFALTNKLTGETKFIEVAFDYEYAESLLKKAERIYKALEDEKIPDACDDISACENCNLQHICGECRRVPADIETDGELDELIAEKEKLKEAVDKYNDISDEIKAKVGEREKIITGTYLIERKKLIKKAFTVPESVQYRLTVKRL